MIDLLINKQPFPLFLLAFLLFLFLVQQCCYWALLHRLARRRKKDANRPLRGVSVVICAHNECHHLTETLPLFLTQDYPEYEVLVVNHSSDDDTSFLLNKLAETYPHLTSVTIHEDLNFFTGKKFPLSIGIKSARYETVLLTDADCVPASPHWIRHMQEAYGPGTEIVLGYGPYHRRPGLLNRLIRFDTAHIAIQYLSYAVAGIPYMGVGRNLSYRKSVFYRNQGFIAHYRIRSGDDDLFINRVADRKNTAVVTEPEAFTFSDPKETFAEWIVQKRRHLSTGHLYKLRHKILLGGYTLGTVLFYTVAILLFALNWSVIPAAALVLLRVITQYVVFAGCLRTLREKDLTPFVPIFEVILLLFNAGIFLSNLASKPTRWK